MLGTLSFFMDKIDYKQLYFNYKINKYMFKKVFKYSEG